MKYFKNFLKIRDKKENVSKYKYKSTLKIYFSDRGRERKGLNIQSNSKERFLDFVKWVHYREKSDFFTLKYTGGSLTIKRESVNSYEITWEEL